MDFISEPIVKKMLMDNKELDFGDGVISELKEEFRINTKLIDILGINRELKRFYIIEIKSKKINYQAIEQILEYLHLFEECLKYSEKYRDHTVQCYLISRLCGYMRIMKHLSPKVKFINYATMRAEEPIGVDLWPSVINQLEIDGKNLFRNFPVKAKIQRNE